MEKVPVAVVLPSKDEAPRIGAVVERVDAGLQELGIAGSSFIFNADNSKDGQTIEAFRAVPTETATLAFQPEGALGKGSNVLAALRLARDRGFERFMMLDTDLTNLTPDWIRLIAEQLDKGADLVYPTYSRLWHEGNSTNHLCVPLLDGFTGVFVPQPLAGDHGLGAKLVDKVLNHEPTDVQQRYGIEILLSATALLEKMQIGRVALGRKDHNPSYHKSPQIFTDVATAFFEVLRMYGDVLPRRIEKYDPLPDIFDLLPGESPEQGQIQARVDEAMDQMHELNDEDRQELPWEYRLVNQALACIEGSKTPEKAVNSLRPHFMLHTAKYHQAIGEKLPEERVGAASRFLLRQMINTAGYLDDIRKWRAA